MATHGEILDQVSGITATEAGVASVSASSAFTSDLGFDGLDYVELIMACEEHFEITIPDDAAQKIETVGELAEFIHFRLVPQCPMPAFLSRTKRISPALEAVGNCGQLSVKTIGWALPLTVGISALAGIPVISQLALPLTGAIAATAIVTLSVAGVEALRLSKVRKGQAMPKLSQRKSDEQRTNGWIAGALVLVVLVISLIVPCPTGTQQRVLQILLALGAAGVVANLPGFLHVELSNQIRAGGALAAFVLVMLLNPASWSVTESLAANASCSSSAPKSIGR
jgi:acyl carrier protein